MRAIGDVNPEVIVKRCSRCREIKPLTEFNRRAASRWDGRNAACADCIRRAGSAARAARRNAAEDAGANRRRC